MATTSGVTKENERSSNSKEVALFAVKELVEVAARTMPGFNNQGGTARISKVRDERGSSEPMKDGSASRTTGFTYDVKYVIGGSERRVDARWISSKTLATREELGEARQLHEAQVKAEKEALAEAQRLLEERKKIARQEVKKRRLAKKIKEEKTKKKTKTHKRGLAGTKEMPVKRRVIKNDKKQATKEQEEDRQNEDDDDDEEEEEEDHISADLLWLQELLGKVEPSDPSTSDELALGDILKFIESCDPADRPPAFQANTKDALQHGLQQLEQANHIMLVDTTVFLV